MKAIPGSQRSFWMGRINPTIEPGPGLSGKLQLLGADSLKISTWQSCSLKSLEKIIWTTIADVQQYPWRVAARTGLRYYRNVTDISIREHPAFKNPISVVEVPVPDALKGKDITILCRAVDSAYSTSSRVFGVSMCLFLGRIDGLCMVIWYMVQ